SRAREERAAASAAGSPPRRRGGGRRAALGGVAQQGSSSARQWAVEEGQLDAWAPARLRTWPGRLTTAPATALHSGGGGKQSRELEEGDKGCFAISKNSW